MDSRSEVSLQEWEGSSSDSNGPAWAVSYGKSRSQTSRGASSQRTGPMPIDPSPMSAKPDRQLSLPSMSSAADSRAPMSASRARVRVSKESTADFGSSTHESLASYDPALLSWKTSQRCLDGEWAEYSETFPSSGTMRSGRLFAQATWAPHTAAIESSSWPTPCARDEKGAYTHHSQGGRDLSSEIRKWPTPIASDANGPREEDGKRSPGLNTRVLTEWPTPTATGLGASNQRGGKKRHAQDSTVSLPEAVRHWPTPRAADGDSGMETFFRGAENPTLLGAVRKQWPTPTSGDGKNAGSRNLPDSDAHAGVSLTDAVIHGGSSTPREWSTPCATPYGRQKTGTDGAAIRPSLETRVKKPGMQLNPAWVETLMGFPIDWTAGPPVPAKRKKRGSRRARSPRKRIRTEESA